MSGDKLPLLVIGKRKKPYCFRHIHSLPTLYRSQSSAWMDSNLFRKYLNKIDTRFQLEQRKCIAFIDNCKAHPPLESLKLKNLRVVFFPPNITSVCQPMDMGIIANLKSNYKNYLSRDKNKCLEHNTVFTVTVLAAMSNLAKSWHDVRQLL